MRELKWLATLVVTVVFLSLMITGTHPSLSLNSTSNANPANPTPSISNAGPNTPFYFDTPTYPGFPTWTTVNGQPALQLTNLSQGSYAGVAWHSLNYNGGTVGASLNGTYTKTTGSGLADGFIIEMFAQNGTGTLSYANNTIPGVSGNSPCGNVPSTGVGGSSVFPLSTNRFFALKWDPFYGASPQFNLWIIDPGCTFVANPGGIGCSIGTPAAKDTIRFDVNYTGSTNIMGARVGDLTSGTNCSFTQSLAQYNFNPSNGNYWVFVEGTNGGFEADWTLIQVGLPGVVLQPTVCITSSPTATSCPFFPSSTSIGVAVGSSTTVGVFVQDSAPMGGFDIYVHADPGYLQAVSAAIGSLIPSAQSVMCINGFLSTGPTCAASPLDLGGNGPGEDNGPGTVQGIAIGGLGTNACGNVSPCSGMAFTITYAAISPIASTSVAFPISQPGVPQGASACMVSSVSSPANVCVLVADAGGGTLPENIEQATVSIGLTTTTTSMFITGTNSPDIQGTTQPLATAVYDSASTIPVAGSLPPSEQVTYYLSTSIYGCLSPFFNVFDTEPLNTPSINTPSLPAGNYAFKAVYAGDSNFLGSTSGCEPLTIAKSSTTTSTNLFKSDGTNILSGGSVSLATSVYDTVAIGPYIAPFQIGGSISYTFYANGVCSGAGTSAGGGSFINGTPPPQSLTEGPLAAGSYSFGVTYTGDANYIGSASPCEPFTVNKASTTTSGLSITENVGALSWSVPPSGGVTRGALLSGSAVTVGTQVGSFGITGTVTYTLYPGCNYAPAWCVPSPIPSCTGTSITTITVNVGSAPSPSSFGGPQLYSATGWCLVATYSGDGNYLSSSYSLIFTVDDG